MESCIVRFPVVGTMILNNLDHQTLVRSKEISKETSEFIKKERFYWIRIIQQYNDNWRQTIKKAPIKDLKDLAIKSEKSYWIRIIEVYMNDSKEQKAWEEMKDTCARVAESHWTEAAPWGRTQVGMPNQPLWVLL